MNIFCSYYKIQDRGNVYMLKNKCMLICCTFMLMLCFFSISVSADNSSVSVDAVLEVPTANSAVINSICGSANGSLGNKSSGILSFSISRGSDSGLLKFKSTKYNKLEVDDKNTFMETSLSAVSKSGLPAKVKNSVYNFIASQDTPISNAMKYLQSDANADFVEAKKLFDPWSSVIGTILGVLCVLIFMFTGLSILFDVFYIVIPGIQLIFDRGEENKKPIFISKEAYCSVRDAEKETEYKNVLSMYLKRRVGLLIIMAICIGYLISGQIFGIIAYLIDAFTL